MWWFSYARDVACACSSIQIWRLAIAIPIAFACIFLHTYLYICVFVTKWICVLVEINVFFLLPLAWQMRLRKHCHRLTLTPLPPPSALVTLQAFCRNNLPFLWWRCCRWLLTFSLLSACLQRFFACYMPNCGKACKNFYACCCWRFFCYADFVDCLVAFAALSAIFR